MTRNDSPGSWYRKASRESSAVRWHGRKRQRRSSPPYLTLKSRRDPRLRERLNWGDIEGQTFDEFMAHWARCSRERDYEPGVGDSSIGAGRRMEAFVSDCYRQFSGDTMIGVTHGGVLADFLLNVFSSEELNLISTGFCNDPYSSEAVPECSVTTIAYDGSQYRLEAVGTILFDN